RFSRALGHTGSGTPGGIDDEPISLLARKYAGALTVSQAASDLFIEDPKELQKLIGDSTELQIQGFDQLLGSKGGIKRDSWKQGFGLVAQQLRIGEFLAPGARTSGGERIQLSTDRGSGATYQGGQEILIRV